MSLKKDSTTTEELESNLTKISALADALWAASLGDNKAMEPKSVKELADMIKGLADESLERLVEM